MGLFHTLKNILKRTLYTLQAQKIADKQYFQKFGRHINWDSPTEFNEKLRCIQFQSDTSLWVTLADKYKVRKYLSEKGYGNLLVKLYGKWNNAADIDFESLPKSFVLKTNNGCGDIIVVKDKGTIDSAQIRERLNKGLNSIFGLNSAQIHYSRIKGCVIAEELLENDAEFSNCIVDYKFYCFGGEPKLCGVYYDRIQNSHSTNSTFYDMNWKRHDEWKNPSLSSVSKDIPRPEKLSDMIQICLDLTKDIPFVRLDFYYIKNRIYFGEYTFTPAACDGGSLNPEIFETLGSWIPKIN